MSQDDSSCVGYKHAEWASDPEWEARFQVRYGHCRHPVAELLRGLPMVVKVELPIVYDIHVDGISSQGSSPACPTRQENT